MTEPGLPAPDFARDSVDHFAYRVFRDAWLDATAVYWRRRAQTFLDARPRRGDYYGHATTASVVDQWQRLTDAAEACLSRATYIDAGRVEFDQALTDLAAGPAT